MDVWINAIMKTPVDTVSFDPGKKPETTNKPEKEPK
jgi:hypothetical protein